MKIEELDDFSYLQQLARALWREGTTRGAAVLVGAGFSRNAVLASADTPKPPLWSTLVKDMAKKLYGDAGLAPSDPLRLAELYRTNFGQAALDEFVRTNIKDATWQPGALHEELLELPWSDILTTNWDTLLERTKTARRWHPVSSTVDLAHGREHRIIKLHGTVGRNDHFIFAEEDYRTYPERYAAFVNTARQIFIENELCLLGFSGDDPNFLQWSGWVRDHLGESARRIYLVGVLDLESTMRKFLESKNIAPIDLGKLVPHGTRDEREAIATAQFIRYLANAKPKAPYEWRPADQAAYTFLPTAAEDIQRQHTDKEYSASLIDQAARIWKQDRESYPGWLVCPPKVRSRFLPGTDVIHWRHPDAIAQLHAERRAEVLYELVWRHNVAFEILDTRLFEAISIFADPEQAFGLLKSQQLEMALVLLRHARIKGDDAAFTRWAEVINTHGQTEPDIKAQVPYQKCLRARDRLEFEALAQELKNVGGPDPAWKLRLAALHCELGQYEKASTLIADARLELLERHRFDDKSLWIFSRLAWTEWLFSVSHTDFSPPRQSPFAFQFEEALCDPETQLEYIKDVTARAVRKRQEESVQTIPQFEAGHYQDSSETVYLSSDMPALNSLNCLIEIAGIPLRFNHYDMIGQSKDDAAVLDFSRTFDWYSWLLRSRHNQRDRFFQRYLGRVAVASLPADVALRLFDVITAVVDYWSKILKRGAGDDQRFAMARMPLYVEALARLTVRQESERARATFDLAINLVRDFSHPWLIEPTRNLAKCSVEAIPPEKRSELVLNALECPLSTEKNVANIPWSWINPFEFFARQPSNRPDGDTGWTHRIAELIQAVKVNNAGRAEAAIRLHYLAYHSALTETEGRAFGSALWSIRDDSGTGLPANTNLLAHTFLKIPAPDGIDREAIIKRRIFETNFAEVLTQPQPLGTIEITNRHNRVLELVAAAGKDIGPSREEALRIFVELTGWASNVEDQDSESDRDPFRLRHQFFRNALLLVGRALADVIIPTFTIGDRTEERAQIILSFIRDQSTSSALAALPYFAHLASVRDEIIRRIRRALAGRNFKEVDAAANAVRVWAELYQNDDPHGLPGQIREQFVSAIETRQREGLHALIERACALVELGRLDATTCSRLDEALGDLILEQEYDKIDPDSPEAVTVSLVRAACVHLARALLAVDSVKPNARKWIEVAISDPLPEVRFA